MAVALPKSRILWVEVVGFAVIIVLSWIDELYRVPDLLFHTPPITGDWHEAALESLITISVGAGVLFLTSRLLQRVLYLEKFLRICAWCKKVNSDGQWIPIENFLRKASDTSFTHGMCEECAAKMMQQASKLATPSRPRTPER